MKITEKWLKKRFACKTGIGRYREIGETDALKILYALIKSGKRGDKDRAEWLLRKLIHKRKPLMSYRNNYREMTRPIRIIFYKLRYSLYKAIGMKRITIDQSEELIKKQGFIKSRQTDSFGHYFRIDPLDPLVGQMLKWHYNDSEDIYYVKWQMWTGQGSKRQQERFPIPKRKDGIEWECETGNEVFSNHINIGFHKMMVYIKNHSEEKCDIMRKYIEKKYPKNLQS